MAAVVAILVLTVSIRVIAPGLPRVVGSPVIDEEVWYTFEDARRLELQNADGAVRVTEGPQDRIEVRARMRIYVREAGHEATAEAYKTDMIQEAREGPTVHLASRRERRPEVLEAYVDYDIRTPRGTDVRITNDNGNVTIGPGAGAVSVQGRNADIVIQRPQGRVEARTLNGRIRANDVPNGATLDTVNGNIYAYMIGGDLHATTTNGAIVVHVLDDGPADYRLISQNGGVTIAAASQAAFEVHAHTEYGTVRSDLSVDVDHGLTQQRRLLGRIGGTEPTTSTSMLHIETLNGNIWITHARRNERMPARGASE